MKFKNVLAAVLMTSICLATAAQAARPTSFDDEKLVERPQVKITATYKKLPLIAWTGTENDQLPQAKLQELAASRANQICQLFSYASGSYDDRDIEKLGVNSHGYLVKDGRLVYMESASQGSESDSGSFIKDAATVTGALLTFMMNVDRARVFTQLTCYK